MGSGEHVAGAAALSIANEAVERALRVRRVLGVFFQCAHVPITVVDSDGAFVSANAAAISQYGWPLDKLVTMRISDLHAVPRGLDSDIELCARDDGTPLERRSIKRRDGSIVWIVPRPSLVEIDGETFVVSVHHDVTPLVSAEKCARVEKGTVEVVWDAAVEHFDGNFAMLDEDRRVLRVNGAMARSLGKSERDLAGKRCDELFGGPCKSQPCLHALAAAEKRRFVDEFERDGLALRAEVWPAPANDARIATIHMSRDLTEERRVRSRLIASDRLASLERVAASVAHEVNNPAAFVTLAIGLARGHAASGRVGEALGMLDEASAAMLQIQEIMRDLSGFARDRPRAIVDLASLANSAIRMASCEAQGHARIERRFEDGLAANVRGARLAQVLLNLVLNAVQATPAGAPEARVVEVRVRRGHAPSGHRQQQQQQQRALIEVADRGPGIDAAVGKRLFEPFFTTRAANGGSGLGLWLSRAIVEEEGGTLTWHNRRSGGACFTVSLPLLEQDGA